MRGGQFSFVRTRTDNDAIESGNAARLLPRRSCMKLASGRRMAPWPGKQSIWTRTGWRQGLGAGVRRNVAASGSVAAGRRWRNSRPAARPGAVAVAFVARQRPFGFPLAVGTAGVFAGLAIATLQTAISDASIGHGACQILIGRWLVGVVLAVGGQSCARRCVGAALSLPQARSPGPWRPPSLTFWWPATDKRRHFAARMAGSLSYAPGVTPLPSRNGWPPTPMRERPRMGVGQRRHLRCGWLHRQLGDSRLVSIVVGIEAFAEDCARAAVVFSDRESPADCNAMLVDRAIWQSYGAVALRWTGDHFTQTVTLPRSQDRP